ncbi:hypothetical protein OG474_38655 [Kribbella sp. NBC_01505]|uniref:hypothetical protein n=1 Tax=Kribbella sp. NBC_01505 TaxID=2903580 RepID=UPI00386A9316
MLARSKPPVDEEREVVVAPAVGPAGHGGPERSGQVVGHAAAQGSLIDRGQQITEGGR